MSLRADLQWQRGRFHLRAAFELSAGQGLALVGPNGAGKSSLLRLLAGFAPGHAGRLTVDGQTWAGDGAWQAADRRSVAAVMQHERLFPHWSVAANLAAGQRFGQRRAEPGWAARVGEALELAPLLARPTASLSGGQVQRVLLARALLSSRPLLLLDEAWSALDAGVRREALQLLREDLSARGRMAVFATHQLGDIAQLADRVAELHEGALSAPEPVAAWLTRPAVAGPAGEGACAVIAGTWGEVEDGLRALRFDGGELWVPAAEGMRTGAGGRACIAARDVSLALSCAKDSSILNRLPAVVDAVEAAGAAHRRLRLRCREQVLLARITRRSCDQLGLAPGVSAWAQVKAVSIY